MFGMEWADVYFGLRGAHNLDVFWDVPSDKLQNLRNAMGKVSSARWQKTRWMLLRVPNEALAHQAGVDVETITDMWFNACLLDWPEVSKEWYAWAEKLNRGKQVRLVGKGTDLSFSVEGRTWTVADGGGNMPDGEIATAPITSTLNGHVYFEFPGVLGGRLVHDIRLEWKEGKLVSATSSTNQGFPERSPSILMQALVCLVSSQLAPTKRSQHFCKDILIDEKIGGTVHMALGRAYPKCGGKNQSAIHWDIVKDTRKEGQIFLDGEMIFENGKVLL